MEGRRGHVIGTEMQRRHVVGRKKKSQAFTWRTEMKQDETPSSLCSITTEYDTFCDFPRQKSSTHEFSTVLVLNIEVPIIIEPRTPQLLRQKRQTTLHRMESALA